MLGSWVRRGTNQAVVIFVHGLFGSPAASWGGFSRLIASDEELTHCDVWLWEYPTSPWGALPRIPYLGRRVPHIPDVAMALRTALCIGEASKYRDLVLVGHSMGGLVIQKMIVDELLRTQPTISLLRRIRCVALYATPSEGVQARLILELHRQARDMVRTGDFVETLKPEWLQRVYGARDSNPPLAGTRFIPVKPVVGLQDNAVPLTSAGSVYTNVESVPGNHAEMCKPIRHEDLAFQVLRKQILMHTSPEWVVGAHNVVAANCRIVDSTQDHLFAIGSRSRDEAYLSRIETMLAERPDVAYWRVLFGAPRNEALKQHLLRVAALHPAADRSTARRTTHIGVYSNTSLQQEHNLVGNERACCVVMPPVTGLGEYDTAYVTTHGERVAGFFSFAQQMYQSSDKLDTIEQIRALRVIP